MSYEEEDACMSYEEEDACMSYEEEDACMSYEEEDACMSSASTSSNEKALIQADTHQSCDVRVYEEEDEEEDACPLYMTRILLLTCHAGR